MKFQILPLEERIVLDAAAIAQAVVDLASDDHSTDHSQDQQDSDADFAALIDAPVDNLEEGVRVLVVSSRVNQSDTFADAAKEGVISVQYDAENTSLEELSAKITLALNGQKADSIAFATHGQNGMFHLTERTYVSENSLSTNQNLRQFWQDVADHLTNEGRVDLLGCNLAQDVKLLDTLDGLLDVDGKTIGIAASTDLTGTLPGANWILEAGNVDATMYFDPVEITQWQGELDNFTVTGRVFQDLGTLGSLDSAIVDTGLESVSVYLFRDVDDDGAITANDLAQSAIDTTTTGMDGVYSFDILDVSVGEKYWVVVDSNSIQYNGISVQPDQTWGPEGSLIGTTLQMAGGAFYGGRTTNGDSATPGTDLANAEHVANVTLTSTAITGLDFGFSFEVITNTNSTGQGSLAKFIENSNLIQASDTLDEIGPLVSRFKLAGSGTYTIDLTDTLPEIEHEIRLDATTQQEWVNSPIVELQSNGISNGFVVRSASNVQISGFAISGFTQSSIVIADPLSGGLGSSDVTVTGNWIGMGLDGLAQTDSSGTGIFIRNSEGITIGSTVDSEQNVIVARGNGIHAINTTDIEIIGNIIGLDPTGIYAHDSNGTNFGNNIGVYVYNKDLSNAVGMTSDAPVIIGGATEAHGNIISNNTELGIQIDGIFASSALNEGEYLHIIQNNLIGTNATGNQVLDPNNDELGNFNEGILGWNSTYGYVADNVVANSQSWGGVGYKHGETSVSNNVFENNFIGTDRTASFDLGNSGFGLSIEMGDDNQIVNNVVANNKALVGNGDYIVQGHGIVMAQGWSLPMTGNVIENNSISNNEGDGVLIFNNEIQQHQTAVISNSIFDNGGIGINLEKDGVTANDPDQTDNDTGANNLQNFPVLTEAFSSVVLNQTQIEGTLTSDPNKTYRIEFFSNPSGTGDPSGHGEGQTYLGFTEVTTSLLGVASIAEIIDFAPVGSVISATATELALDSTPLSTSEFSSNITVSPSPTISGSILHDLDSNGLNDDGAVGLENVTVILYEDSGNGVLGLEDSTFYITTTASDGSYTFDTFLQDGLTYHVAVVAPNQSGVLFEQTYGPSSGFGGENRNFVDGLQTDGSSSNLSEHHTTLTFNGFDVTSMDFGFSSEVITNTLDTGQGSLRQMITNANLLPGLQASVFELNPLDLTIDLLSGLPVITDVITLDGTSDGVTPIGIILNGSQIPQQHPSDLDDGLILVEGADGSKFLGFTFTDFPDEAFRVQLGVDDLEFGYNTFSNIGQPSDPSNLETGGAFLFIDDPVGTVTYNTHIHNNTIINNEYGISGWDALDGAIIEDNIFDGFANVVINGTYVNSVIQNNQFRNGATSGMSGSYIDSSILNNTFHDFTVRAFWGDLTNATFQGNTIYNISVDAIFGNITDSTIQYNTIYNYGSGGIVGTFSGGTIHGNEIYDTSGNGSTAISLIGEPTELVLVTNNEIYNTDPMLQNAFGISVFEDALAVLDGNSIMNANNAISLSDNAMVTVSNNVLQNNYNGMTSDGNATAIVDGNQFLENAAYGITMWGNANFTITNNIFINHGANPGEIPSSIHAISVGGNATAVILNNTIDQSSGLGIQIIHPREDGTTKVDPIEPYTGETGPNMLQNYPELTSFIVDPQQYSDGEVIGSLTSKANTTYRIQFFANDDSNPSGHGEGRYFGGEVDVTTDSNGYADITAFLSFIDLTNMEAVDANNLYITATATELDMTDPMNPIPLYTSEFAENIESTLEAVGGYILEDINANGINELSDVGIEGVTVYFYEDDGDQIADSDDTLIATTVTNEDGFYSFDQFSLNSGIEYWIVVDASTIAPNSGLLGSVMAEQTFGPDSLNIFSTVAKFGGEDRNVMDNLANGIEDAEHRSLVSVDAFYSNFDFGFSYEAVVNTNSSGQGSLAQVVTNANALAGPQTTLFRLDPNESMTITLSAPLPAILDSLSIDGTTQEGYIGTPLVQIDGGNSQTGIVISGAAASGSTVTGLSLGGFVGDAIQLDGGVSDVLIEQNYIGIAKDGQTALGNSGSGVVVNGASDVSITQNYIGNHALRGVDVVEFDSEDGPLVVSENTFGQTLDGTAIAANGAAAVRVIGTLNPVLDVTIENNTILNSNLNDTDGGAITIDGSFMNVKEVTVQGNTIGSSGGSGVYVNNSQDEVEYVELPANGAVFTGAGGDLIDGSTIVFPIEVTGAFLDSELLSITLRGFEHSYSGDLEVILHSPDGTAVGIINSYSTGNIPGGFQGGATYFGGDYTFVSSGGDTLPGDTEPHVNPDDGPGQRWVPGTYNSDQSFSLFSGASAIGTWEVEIIDWLGIDSGTLGSIELTFPGSGPSTFAPVAPLPSIQILNNYIGTDSNDTQLANGANGVRILNSTNVLIQGNTIAYNANDGVNVEGNSNTDTTGLLPNTVILENSMHDNGTATTDLGIDLLGLDGVDANDDLVDDADSGPNDLQNYPVITSAFISGAGLNVEGTFDSKDGVTYLLEFYVSTDLTNPQGELLYGSEIFTDPGGTGNFSFVIPYNPVVTTDVVVTATATELVDTILVVEGSPNSQYATSATASSSYGANPGDGFHASQATGAPDTLNAGDISTAWAPQTSGSDPEYLELFFDTPVFATGLDIYESNIGGFVTSVELIDTSGTYHSIAIPLDTTTVLEGEPVTPFSITIPETNYLVEGVRIHTQISGWEEIDAVMLFGIPQATVPHTLALNTSEFSPAASVDFSPIESTQLENQLLMEDEETQLVFDLNTYFTDLDGDDLLFTLDALTLPSYLSSVSINASDELVIDIVPDEFGGPTLISFTVDDQTGNIILGDMTIEVLSVNDQPTLSLTQTTITILEDAGPQAISGFAVSDLGPDNEDGSQSILNYIVTHDQNPGFFTQDPFIDSNGELTFEVAPDQFSNPPDHITVTVQVQDDGGTVNGGIDLSDPATFTIEVTSVNDLPVANDDFYFVDSITATSVTSTAEGLLGNDTDGDGDSLTIVNLTVMPPSEGSVNVNVNDGTFTYTPTGSFTGTTSFTYQVYDGTSNSTNTATVTLQVAPVFNVSGSIIEDEGADGIIAEENGFEGVTVYLLLDDGDGVIDSSQDTLLATEITNSLGEYFFAVADNGYTSADSFWVIVDSKSIEPNGLNVTEGVIWAEQTYGSANSLVLAGAEEDGLVVDGLTDQAGALFGGIDPNIADSIIETSATSIRVVMNDSYGDGWNDSQWNPSNPDNYYEVIDTNSQTQVATGLLVNLGAGENTHFLYSGSFEFNYYGNGPWANENSWTVYDGTGAFLFSGAGPGEHTFQFNLVGGGSSFDFDNAEHVTKVIYDQNDVAGIDFGFSYEAITNTNVSEQGSLAQMISNSNEIQAADFLDEIPVYTSEFRIPVTGLETEIEIRTDNLFFLTSPINLDATTQEGFDSLNPVPFVVLDGSDRGGSQPGIIVAVGSEVSETTLIKGFEIRNMPGHGMSISNLSTNVHVLGNTIHDNGRLTSSNSGILLNSGTSQNVIGGANLGEGNLIYGHYNGIFLANSDDNIIQGNIIGTDGVHPLATGNTNGIAIYNGSANNQVGGSNPGEGNIISGNLNIGIQLGSIGTQNNKIQGNFIGTDLTGTVVVGNGGSVSQSVGIWADLSLDASTTNMVGGLTPEEGNVIANTIGGTGILVESGNLSILNNSIYGNDRLGIDLGLLGPLDNDLAGPDEDTGPNGLQNYPELTGATFTTSPTNTLTITGSLQSTPDTTFLIEFFVSSTADESGYGEGETSVGIATVTTDGSGLVNFSESFDNLSFILEANDVVTATATLLDDQLVPFATSEFSASLTPNLAPLGTLITDPVIVLESDLAMNSGTYNDPEGGAVMLVASIGSIVDEGGGDWTWTYNTTDGPDDSNTVVITLTDEEGATSTLSFDLQVDNVSPTVELSGNSDVDEGSTYTLTISNLQDPGTETVTDYIVHWGDGNTETFDALGNFTHTYDDGSATHTITVDIVDDDGTHVSAGSFEVFVNNVDPLLDSIPNRTVITNYLESFDLGSFTDPGDDDPWLVTVDWGDTSTSNFIVNNPGLLGSQNHTYTTPGVYTVTVTVAEENGAESSGTTTFEVNVVENSDPTLEVDQATTTASEGTVATNTGTYEDIDGHPLNLTASIGVVQDLGGGIWSWTFDAEDGPDQNQLVIISATDGFGGTGSIQFNLNVSNEDPVITSLLPSASSITSGDSVDLTTIFTDLGFGANETFTYVINWDDSNTDSGNVTAVTAGSIGTPTQGTFSETHTYLAAGTYTVEVVVTDDDGGVSTETTTIEVIDLSGVPDILSLTLDPNPIDEGGTTVLTVTFQDYDAGDTHTVTVNWGDGEPDTVLTLDVGTRTQTFTHTYLDDGLSSAPSDDYSISVVIDDGTDTDTDSVDLTVLNVAPEITAIGTDATLENKKLQGEEVSFAFTFTDVGVEDTHTAEVNWGDGTVETVTVVDGRVDATHVYTQGGLYDIVATLTDDDTGAATDSVTAVITGVGVHDGVLTIVGTNERDVILIRNEGQDGDYEVRTNFTENPLTEIDINTVSSIHIFLCGGETNHVKISKHVLLDAIVEGSPGNDRIRSGSGNDILMGGDGDDRISGLRGNDIIMVGAGDDRAKGGQDDDILLGGPGHDYLKGGNDDDILMGGMTVVDESSPIFDAIRDEWTRSDLTFAEKRTIIAPSLDAVQDNDDEMDILIGNQGYDWFWGDFDQTDREKRDELRNRLSSQDVKNEL